jgi:hypothetical protein
VAIFSHGAFLTMPAFSHRVQAHGNAGLSLSGLHVGDSGNYTVEVQINNGPTSHVILRRTVSVIVTGM